MIVKLEKYAYFHLCLWLYVKPVSDFRSSAMEDLSAMLSKKKIKN